MPLVSLDIGIHITKKLIAGNPMSFADDSPFKCELSSHKHICNLPDSTCSVYECFKWEMHAQ